MKKADYVRVDVFAKKPFGGNALAVFPDADHLTGREMQLLAREMNLSETTFVLRPTKDSGADFRVRIFTPDMEVPYAGHPTLGTFYVLGTTGRVGLNEPVTELKMEVRAGVLPVEIHSRNGVIQKVVSVQKKPIFGKVFDVEDVAAALSLRPSDFVGDRAPPQLVSTGLPWLLAPVKSRRAIEKLKPNLEAFVDVVRKLPKNVVDIYVTSLDPVDRSSTTHSRGLSLVLGTVVEDPATGSASGDLGAYLVHYGLVPMKRTVRLVNEQGYEMGRPSKIFIEVGTAEDGSVESVKVGGTVVRMMDGTAYL